jgi:phospholipase C
MAMKPWRHLVVLTQENHSFDQMFGHYPGVDGTPQHVRMPNPRGAPVSPFPYSHRECALYWTNPPHSWNAIHEEWDHGKMDGFVRVGGPMTMGYFPDSWISGYRRLAERGILLDHYHAAVLGPTLPNRLYLISGTSAGSLNDPPVGSRQTFEQPTVFDQLLDAHIRWAYYIDGYHPTPISRAIAKASYFCPLLWFPRFQQDPRRARRLQPLSQFFRDVRRQTLPDVVFIAPGLWTSGHPPTPIALSMRQALAVYRALSQSPTWSDTLLILNFDEAGGYYDHVPPPVVDTFGPGIRVPAIMLSGRFSAGISHTVFDHTSVLRLIEEQYGFPLLGTRTRHMNSLAAAWSGL